MGTQTEASGKRRIAVIIGSKTDGPQCLPGLRLLAEAERNGLVTVKEVVVSSIHRNTELTLDRARMYVQYGDVDVVIAGAGWANHLTGTFDAFLRHTLRDTHIVVVGVAFEDEDSLRHTEAARLSIMDVPGTQVVFENFVGEDGFIRACEFAVSGTLPTIKLSEPRRVEEMTLAKALARERW